ncbi:MAG TPA: tetratricopeptide repeat protein [Haliangium sp.]|nr:tetratricopeptide repeat protein [Haliangium sp.]
MSTRSRSAETWQSALRRGLEHQRAGRLEQAESCFVQAHRLAPDRPEVCYALGRARLRTGAIAEAERLLRAAWLRDRSLVSAAGTLARCLGLHAGRFEDAHGVLDEAATEHGAVALLAVVRGELLLAQDRLEEARAAADAALLAQGSGNEREAARAVLARVANREGILCAERGETDRALFLFRQAAHLDSSWSSPHVNQGAVLTRMAMTERAAAAYDRAVAIEPDNPRAYENRGLLRKELGDLEGARSDLSRVLKLEPQARAAAVALAAVHRALHDPRAVAAVLADAVEHAADDVELWCELGVAFADAGDRNSAEACWRRVLQLVPDHPGACTHLASLLVRDGRLHEAAVLARRVPDQSAASREDRSQQDK